MTNCKRRTVLLEKQKVVDNALAILDCYPEVSEDLVDWHHLTCRRLGLWVPFDSFCAWVKRV